MRRSGILLILAAAAQLAGCAYRPYASDLAALPETDQGQGMAVADDGTVTFVQGRLEIALRPVTDDELNRQFAAYSGAGAHSTNPYTYGNSKVGSLQETPRRFTVFMLSVKNYEYPKVLLSGDLVLESQNSRKYYGLSLAQLDVYYRAYAVGYRGIDHFEYSNRRDVLNRTMFPFYGAIFSGQEAQGYVMFHPLADDVSDITVRVTDVVTRFDYGGAPVESLEAVFRFKRDVGRIYPDGSIVLSGK
jgi:hypothetical protein